MTKLESLLAAVKQKKDERTATVASADKQLETAIKAARKEGATWAAIGEALGTSRQAAYEKYGRKS